MLKKTLLIALGALLAQGVSAEVLSPEAALLRAGEHNGSKRMISAAVQPKLAYTARTAQGEPAVYVFSQEQGGALIVSASSLARPVLGYTDSGSFDPANIPPQMRYWLEEYAAQIEAAEQSGIEPKSSNVEVSYPSSWSFISPLVKTKWDQGKPYNEDIKVSYMTSVATGCVATAMAQVMKYHEFPEVGHGSITYQSKYGPRQDGTWTYISTQTMNFAENPFDWANMIDDYTGSYTAQQGQAVALLMKACGYASQMQYGGSSGTQVERSAVALATFFNYDSTIEALQRYNYSHTEWATILYNQLKEVGPVIYSGHSLGNLAHAFVCDGYDGQGYFHINWGWSGLCDGYYSLDAMIPTAQGTGGSNYGGYNFSQGMIVNITPSDNPVDFKPVPVLTLLGNASCESMSSVLTFTMTEANPGNLCNNSLFSITPTLGIKMENLSTGAVKYNEASAVYFDGREYAVPQMGPGSFIDPQLSLKVRFDTQLPDGKYKVQLVWKDKTADNTWFDFQIANGCHDYAYVTKSGSNYQVENFPMARFTVEKAEIITPLYMRNPCQIQFTVTNPNDIELTQSIVPVLHYEENGQKILSFEGDSQLVTVGPNQTITTTATYTFMTVAEGISPTVSTPREYTLGAYDYSLLLDRYYQKGDFRESYYGDYGTVTMKRPGSNSTLQLRKISIDNAHEEGMVEGVGFMYGLTNFSYIDLGVEVYGRTGFVAAPLSAVVSEYYPQDNTTGPVVYEKNFENLIFVEEGDTSTQNTTLQMPTFDVSKIYQIQVYYVQQSSRISLGVIRFGAASGVENVIDGGALALDFDGSAIHASSEAGLATATVYDLSGKTVASPSCYGADSLSIDASALAKGIYIVKVADAAGNSKVLKIRN